MNERLRVLTDFIVVLLMGGWVLVIWAGIYFPNWKPW